MQMASGESELSKADGGHSMNLVKLKRNAAFTSYSSRGSAAMQKADGNQQRHAARDRTTRERGLEGLLAEYLAILFCECYGQIRAAPDGHRPAGVGGIFDMSG